MCPDVTFASQENTTTRVGKKIMMRTNDRVDDENDGEDLKYFLFLFRANHIDQRTACISQARCKTKACH